MIRMIALVIKNILILIGMKVLAFTLKVICKLLILIYRPKRKGIAQ